MEDQIINALVESFPDTVIKTRRGSHGKELKFLETWRVIERLNVAFEHDWTLTILEWRVMENEVVVHAELEAAGSSKQAFGSSTITRNRDSGEAISIGDDVKAAGSDALKKAATLFGVGLELYSGRSAEVHPRKPPANAPSAQENCRETSRAKPSAPNGPHGPSGITERQLQAVLSLAESRGGGAVAVRTQVLDRFGVPVEQLTRRQASQVISALNNGGIVVGGGS